MATHEERAKLADKLKSQVDDLNQRIDETELKSALGRKELEEETQLRYQAFLNKRDDALQKLEELREVSDGHWHDVKSRAEELVRQTSAAFEDLKNRLTS